MNHTKPYRVAVLGASGLVGSHMLSVLADRQLPIETCYPLASARSAGKTVVFKDKTLTIEDVATFDFSQVDFALFSAGGEAAKHYGPIAVAAGCTVIDNSSAFRYDDDIALIIPEVNGVTMTTDAAQIIANPNCSTIQMLVALKPIYDAVGITRINVATYQAVAGSGLAGIDDLKAGLVAYQNQHTPTAGQAYNKPIAFNVLPQIDTFQENGYTREEMKMVWETQKILADTTIKVNPTAVRVPVFTGHAEAIHLETRDKITAQQVGDLLAAAPGLEVFSGHDYPTPLEQGDGTDAVFVGRIREDISHPHGINLWVVADNIRKGAALNAVQILECLLEKRSD